MFTTFRSSLLQGLALTIILLLSWTSATPVDVELEPRQGRVKRCLEYNGGSQNKDIPGSQKSLSAQNDTNWLTWRDASDGQNWNYEAYTDGTGNFFLTTKDRAYSRNVFIFRSERGDVLFTLNGNDHCFFTTEVFISKGAITNILVKGVNNY